MKLSSAPVERSVAGFRARLMAAMALLSVAITGSALYYMQRKAATEMERALQADFQGTLAALHQGEEIRQAVLAERCRTLVRRPRIHAALEDNGLDLLYQSAQDELRDLMSPEEAAGSAARMLEARFYRFLDSTGAVIPPDEGASVGPLQPAEEAALAQTPLSSSQQLGYLRQQTRTGQSVIDEVLAMPIVSSETGEVIAALVLGFAPVALPVPSRSRGLRSGLWVGDELYLPGLAEKERPRLLEELKRYLAAPPPREVRVVWEGATYRLFGKRLNPGSVYPPAYEVSFYPLTDFLARQRRLVWQAAAACALLLLGGVAFSHLLAGRLARPVEKLALDSEEHRASRVRAETALQMTSAELQRAARFSADASHQLKTPVTVLRAGLEELLALDALSPEMREEVAGLVHQTFRLTSIVEDLLLLSRLEAGRLQLRLGPVDLTPLLEGLVDDLSVLPEAREVHVESACPSAVVAGERRYLVIILQNLLENAHKYNRSGGGIRIACREEGEWLIVAIGNTGPAIPLAAREHIFERFHRGAKGENIPGHGLGLNLARELARLHGGDLQLTRTEPDWTEFEVRFHLAEGATSAYEPA